MLGWLGARAFSFSGVAMDPVRGELVEPLADGPPTNSGLTGIRLDVGKMKGPGLGVGSLDSSSRAATRAAPTYRRNSLRRGALVIALSVTLIPLKTETSARRHLAGLTPLPTASIMAGH